MSSCRKNRRGKIKKQNDIELTAIIKFVKFIQVLSSGMLGLSILGIVLVGRDIQAQVLYTMVIITNLLIVLLGIIAIRGLESKKRSNN